MPSRDSGTLSSRQTRAVLVLAVLAALTLVYSILVMQAVWLWFAVWVGGGTTLFVLYMLWRFVRAHERVADALESDGTGTTVPEE